MNQICDYCDKKFDRICFCCSTCRIKFNNGLRKKKPDIKIPTIQTEQERLEWEEIKKKASFL